MSRETKAFLLSLLKEITVPKMALFLFMVLLAGNLSALVDSVLHPDIPYFDEEHLVIGGAYALLLAVMFLTLAIYVTKLKMAAKTLSESADKIIIAERDWERTFDAITEPIMILDVNYKIVKANKAMADKLGVTTSGAKGLTCYNAVHNLQGPPPSCPHSKLLADGQVHTTEIYEARLGGHFIITVSPIYDPDGRLIGSIHAGTDISERIEAEKALKESEEKFRNIFDQARDIIFTVGIDTLFTSVNPAFEKVTGWSREDWLGKSFASILHPEDLPRAVGILQRTIQGEAVDMFELRVKKKSGEYFIGEFTVALIKQGETVTALGLVRDITERRLNEEKISLLTDELEMKVEERTKHLLEAQEELVRKEKLATLGQLSGSVGHELRNPLGVMSNAVYYLKTVMSDADENVKEYLNIIKSEIDNSQRIITDLLDFTRTKTPRAELIIVDELIKQSLGKCTVPRDVTVQVEIPGTLPAVRVDPLQMGQVFQNLVTNAIQAMPRGGELRISAGSAVSDQGSVGELVGAGLVPAQEQKGHPQRAPLQDFIEISVSDNGEGIPPENMSKLFQPLFTSRAKGIGLGLTVVKNLIEANGGSIEVESESGKGTTFMVMLPVIKEMKAEV